MERRQYPRVDLVHPAIVSFSGGQQFDCTILNYSQGGLYIQCKGKGLWREGCCAHKSAESLDRIQIKIDTSSNGFHPFSVGAKVAFLSRSGFGVSFLMDEPELLSYLTSIKKQRETPTGQTGGSPDIPSLPAHKLIRTLQRGASLTRDYFSNKFPAFLTRVERDLQSASEAVADSEAERELLDALHAIQGHHESLSQGFLKQLERAFETLKSVPDSAVVRSPAEQSDEMALVARDDFDEWIEVVRVSRMADVDLAAEGVQLERGLACLLRQRINPETNPLSPYFVLWTMKTQLEQLGVGLMAKRIVYEAIRFALIDEFSGLFAEWIGLIKATGIETQSCNPESDSPPPGEVRKQASVGKRQRRTLFGRLSSMVGRQKQTIAGARPAQDAPRVGQQEVMQLLDRIPYSHYLSLGEQIRNHVAQGWGPEVVIEPEVLGRVEATEKLFASIEEDRVIGPAMLDLVHRLRLPFLKQALENPQVIDDPAHPSRRLLDVIGELSLYSGMLAQGRPGAEKIDAQFREIGEAALKGDILETPQLHQRIQSLLDERRQAFEGNRDLAVRSCREDAAQLEAQRSVRRLLEGKFGNQSISNLLDRLLINGWAELLVQTLTTQGEDSNAWRVYLRMLDVLSKLFVDGKELPAIEPAVAEDIVLVLHKGFSIYPVFQEKAAELIQQIEHALNGDTAVQQQLSQSSEQMDEIYLDSLLPESRDQMARSDRQGEHDLWLNQVYQMELDDWLTEHRQKGQARLMNLAWKSSDGEWLVFVDGSGVKSLETNAVRLGQGLQQGLYALLEDKELPLVERAVRSALEKSFEQLRQESDQDRLTGLMNRRALMRELKSLLQLARDEGSHHSLILLDLDKFRIANEVCGIEGGDHLLQKVSGIFRTYLSGDAQLARTGDNEFTILLPQSTVEKGFQVAETQRRAIENFKFSWNGHSINITASLGIVVIDDTSGSPEELMAEAGYACSLAKSEGQNCSRVYQASRRKIERHRELTRSVPLIEEALEGDRLQLYCQLISPLFLAEGEQDHYEILLRIKDENGDPQNPVSFIKAAEEFNRIRSVDRWVVNSFFDWYEKYAERVDRVGLFSVNLSGQSLSDANFMGFVKDRLMAASCPLDRIGFEITETALVKDIEAANRVIDEIKQTGCKFLLDDFGSGYSSFSYLKELKVDYVKIDGVFVKDLLDDESSRAMVKGITEIAQMMGKKVIAEYVESEALMIALQNLQVDFAQGYAVGRPAPLNSLIELGY